MVAGRARAGTARLAVERAIVIPCGLVSGLANLIAIAGIAATVALAGVAIFLLAPGAGYRCVMAASRAKTIIGRPQTIARAWAARPQISCDSFRKTLSAV